MEKNSFFYDNSEGNPAELLIDYFLSWTLRCAIDGEQKYISKTVKEYSKEVLYYFLEPALVGVEKGDIKVLKVETVKQWKKIDLLCVIKIKIKTEPEPKWFALAFENKMYTKLHDNQLEMYINAVDERFFKKKVEKLFIYITTHEKVPPKDLEQCKINSYRPLTLEKVTGHLQEKYPDRSGNELFDEFWYSFKRE